MSGADVIDRAAELRRSFDAEFAAAPRDAEVTEAVLVIRAADQPYVVPLAAIAGLHADRRITALPTPVPGLLGVAGLRDAIVPVYSLAALLGHDPRPNARWLVMTQAHGGEPLALAFDDLAKHARIPKEMISPSSVSERAHVRAVATIDGQPIPVLDIAAIVAVITQRAKLVEERSAE